MCESAWNRLEGKELGKVSKSASEGGGCGENAEVAWNELFGRFFGAWKWQREDEFWVLLGGCGKTGLQVVAALGVME